MRKPKELHNFYKSDVWKVARQIKITQAKGMCERCGKIGEEVHHKEHLTIYNVKEVKVSLGQDNLELLCKECHNLIHNRFYSKFSFDVNGDL